MPETPLIPHIAEAEASPLGEVAEFMAMHDTSSTSVVDERNWAKDPSVVKYVMEHVYSMLDQVRNDYSGLHAEWRTVARMAVMQHDSGQRYKGRSNAYIPSYARARKTLVASLSQGLLPSDEYLSVTDKERPSDPNPVNALAVKTYIQWELEKNAHLRRQLKPFLGSLIDYGIGVIKFWYEKHSKGMKQGRATLRPGTKITEAEYKSYKADGLRISPRNVFDWYVFPYNIDDVHQATLTFEDVMVSRSYIKERQRKGEWEHCDMMLDATEISTAIDNKSNMESENMASSSNLRQFAGSDIGDQLTVTEIWCDLMLPKAAYMNDEDPDCPVPCKIVMGGDVVAQVVRNPFWHQCSPYEAARDDPKAGMFFSKGTGYVVKSIQYLINDFSNQMNDNGNMGMNPVIIANPSTLAGPLPTIAPGKVFMTTDVANGIKFDRPPIEQIQYGMSLVTLYAGMLADHSGATPSLQGQNAGKGGKTATGMQLLQKNAMNPLKDMIEDIEESVFTPLINKTWILAQQYREEQFMMEVMGDTGGWSPKSMTREQLIGDFIFRWLASNQAANQQQRAQQGAQLLTALNPFVVQLLVQNGHQVNPYPLLKRLYNDLLGFRDFDQFVLPKQMMPGQPGMLGSQPQPGQPGQQQLPSGGVRSATEQNPQGSEPEASTMAPGEGDEFAALRAEVEAMTGEQGEEVPQEG